MMQFLNKIGNFFLDTAVTPWPGPAEGSKPTDTTFWPDSFGWLANLFNVLNPILYAIMAVVGAAGAIYAIILGINLAKAEDTSKRDEAKKHLITVLIAVAITIALVLFFNLLMPQIIVAFLY